MKVFVLEDDPVRMRFIREWLFEAKADIDHIESSRDFRKFDPPYDLILLDHDLGGRQMEPHMDNGLSFVRMTASKFNPEALVVVHSYNYEGAKRMVERLDAEHIQASWLCFGGVEFRKALTIAQDRAKLDTSN